MAIPVEPLESTPPRFAAPSVEHFTWLRHDVTEALGVSPGSDHVTDDFLLPVDEVTTNATLHGRPPVHVRLWTSTEKLVCTVTVTDSGTGMDDPFAGCVPAPREDPIRGGMGLWLARQLCDHVDIWHDDLGTTVRLVTHLTRAEVSASAPALRGGPGDPEV